MKFVNTRIICLYWGLIALNNFSAKSLFELCAFLPLVLLALAGCYKFGYLRFFDASWLLPSLNVQGFIYSILGISLIVLAGVAAASVYSISAFFFGHLWTSLALILVPVFSIWLGTDNQTLFFLLSKVSPFVLGVIYFIFLRDVFSQNEISSMFRVPAILFSTFVALMMMAFQGSSDAEDRIRIKDFPVVELGTLTEDSSKDWRLLEASGSNLILINLNSPLTKSGYVRYEIKIVEANKVDLVY